MQVHRHITRPLGQHEQHLLETKYRGSTFRNVRKIPSEYPTWALRNIRVCEWWGSWSDANVCNMATQGRANRPGDQMLRDKKYRFRSAGRHYKFGDVQQWQPRTRVKKPKGNKHERQEIEHAVDCFRHPFY